LREQHRGCRLDVTEPEPLPPAIRWDAAASSSRRTCRRTPIAGEVHQIVRENLRRYVAGEAMLSVVDVERGY
jgi:phosphoglycerate dehydrogenase-like enzyme